MSQTKITQTIKKFRGLNQFISKAILTPDCAEDLSNVIVSLAGYLSKVRYPVALTGLVGGIGVAAISRFLNFAQGVGTRYVFGWSGQSLISWDVNAGYAPVVIDTRASNASGSIWDFASANNILFMTNLSRAVKWLGAGYGLLPWGLPAPAAPTFAALVVVNIATTARAGNIATVTTAADCNFNTGDTVVVAGATDPTFNGTPVIQITGPVDNRHFSYANPGPNVGVAGSAGTATISPGYAITASKSWKVSWGYSVTGDEGSMSVASAIQGINAVATGYHINIPAPPVGPGGTTAPADNGIDIAYVYSILDGGSDYFLEGTVAVAGLATSFNSASGDAGLNQLARGQLINGPPTAGKYLAVWGGRIFIAKIVGGPQTVQYTGYELILRGRPENCVPPNNALLLSIGADELRGLGVMQVGIVAFDKSAHMFMLRGLIQDVAFSQPITLTQFLEQLPYNEGCLSHFTIRSTKYGLIWLGADKTVKVFDGSSAPSDISFGAYPILRTITAGSEESCQAEWFNYVERDWYVLAIPTNGSPQCNKILLFDLTASDNLGIFVIDQLCDSLGVIEDSTGVRRLCIAFQGSCGNFRSATTQPVGSPPTRRRLSTYCPHFGAEDTMGTTLPR
jgi:hypothetical protein